MAKPRTQARRYAVLALYQWHLMGETPVQIAQQFYDDPQWIAALEEELRDAPADHSECSNDKGGSAHPEYAVQLFDSLLRGVPEQIEAIDNALQPALDRSLKSIDPVERVILSIGVYELLFSPELPAAVVINEAVDLAKLFGAEQGHRYINGVLDRVARQMRKA
ncbi:transcription antitermination factor NusB [Thiospirillum jenense]|uniref:Transcription antitermination protein NusB n=1 Tax=Thiospirillum jenense TaxID=1653858 RepID=A0A839H6D6_9GAMM|nr:transcription antitermination factor NusB [Thiospirillum jenense]MBB1125091.1 transcription antitermination factor NusB [Thiospirillum jenense]